MSSNRVIEFIRIYDKHRIDRSKAMVAFLQKYDPTEQEIQKFIATPGVNIYDVVVMLGNSPTILKKYFGSFIKFWPYLKTRDVSIPYYGILEDMLKYNNPELIKILLDNGFNFNIYDLGKIFDHDANFHNDASFNIVKLAIEKIDESDKEDVMDFAMDAGDNRSGNINTIKYLLDKGFKPSKSLDTSLFKPDVKKFVKEYEYKKTTPGLAQVSVGKKLPQNVTSNIASMLSPSGKPPKSFLPKPDVAAREAIQAEKEALAAMRTGGKTRKYRGKKSLKSKRKTSKK